MVATTHILIW